MAKEMTKTELETKIEKAEHHGGSSDNVYGLGLIGAWVYYIPRAKNFKEGLLGFLKGFVWPAIFVYEGLKLLNKE